MSSTATPPPPTSAASASPTAEAATSTWPTYHLDASRSGDDMAEPSFAGLTRAWASAPLDGAVYAEPLIAGGLVIVATEHDSLYAFDAATGALRWHTSLGTPRTSNFPCGDVMPLGITGTPVIDGGRLYALAEIESAGVYRFHLAAVDPSTGAVVYNDDVTPAGMLTNTEQERGALAVSGGNVIISWGGLDGDCGSYHGYVEAVAESSGAVQAQWHDTPDDNQGGIWTPSGPAIDGAGDIYVTTGNGSSADITKYDDGDSVVELSPALTLRGFFAPGPPQSWTSLNADDQDLGSVGPVLLSGGLLFAVGKGGRGYLLSQSALPSRANPPGGETDSAAVCHASSNAAYAGMAVRGPTVFVACADGIAAVHVDSPRSFHTLWYSSSPSSSPILAGGLLWTTSMFGGNQLVGLDPATGAVRTTLSLPVETEHFVTPAAAGGRLFLGDGDRLVAFAG